MTDETRRPGCLDANMMAEYIDGGLEPRQRAEVEAHLAECGECYENFSETVRANVDVAPAARDHSVSRRWLPLLIASAAALVLVVRVTPDWLESRASRAQLANVLATPGAGRVAEARIADSREWAPRPSPLRGPGAASIPDLGSAWAGIIDAAAGSTNGHRIYSAAIAHMARGEWNDAIASFSKSLEHDGPRNDVLVSMAACYIERSRQQGRGDLETAVQTLDSVPESGRASSWHFNRALALEMLGNAAEAVAEWRRYVAVELDQRWRAEGEAHIKNLDGRSR